MAADTIRPARRFRSRDWLDDPARMDQTAIYLERFMNYGITPEESRSGNPLGAVAAPANRNDSPLLTLTLDALSGPLTV